MHKRFIYNKDLYHKDYDKSEKHKYESYTSTLNLAFESKFLGLCQNMYEYNSLVTSDKFT